MREVRLVNKHGSSSRRQVRGDNIATYRMTNFKYQVQSSFSAGDLRLNNTELIFVPPIITNTHTTIFDSTSNELNNTLIPKVILTHTTTTNL
jgi:hypothetical protein